MALENLSKMIDDFKNSDIVVDGISDVVKRKNSDFTSSTHVCQLGTLIEEVLKKYGSKKSDQDYAEWLMTIYKRGVELLENICSHGVSEDTRLAALNALLGLIPLYNETFHEKPMFPNQEFAAIIRALILSDEDISNLLPPIRDLMAYEDMSRNIWKALDLASKMDRLPNDTELRRILHIISTVEPFKEQEGPKLYYSRVKVGVLNNKEMDKCVKRIWERLSRVKIGPDSKQLLLLALLEKMMNCMDRPIFLIDYFMASLEQGGAIGVLSLQGIFNLIQKYNMNYPNVYEKLYAMLEPELFRTTYKSRFYYLADLFLSSAMLPETLVAGFIKRLARLALVAPPTDIIILMAFITNLLVRHSNLKTMLTRPGSSNFTDDPYLEEEKDPSRSRAEDSCLWEVKLLQDHVLPSVANSANFINQELPKIEKDMSSLLDNKLQNIFTKEMSIKLNEPATTHERPTSTLFKKRTFQMAFSTWV